jgi:hypothetical protein
VALGLLWTPRTSSLAKGKMMAEEEPLLVDPPTQDVAVHVHHYARFTKMMRNGAIACLIIGFIVLLILR